MENMNDTYKKRNPFTTPEGYFEDLTERVMKRVEQEKKARKRKTIPLSRSHMGWAAVFVGILSTIQVLYTVVSNRQAWKSEETEQIAHAPASGDKDIFDSHFNPTNDEIIEYLASEVDNYEWMIASVY